MTIFRTVFYKHIFDAEEANPHVRFTVVQREEQLPFAPSPGHEFFWGAERPKKVVTVSWNIEERYFSCKVEDEFPGHLSIDGYDFDELVDFARMNGWSLVKEWPANSSHAS